MSFRNMACSYRKPFTEVIFTVSVVFMEQVPFMAEYWALSIYSIKNSGTFETGAKDTEISWKFRE